MHRSLVVRMTRADGSHELARFDDADSHLQIINDQLYIWVRKNAATLNGNPSMPAALRNRAGDNWRVLFSIADACGPNWGHAARECALVMTSGYQDEDALVTLLGDIRDVFEARRIDRISSAELVEALLAMDDAPWTEWSGLRNDRQPRRLSQTELARLLAPFRIRPRTIWPHGRTAESKSRSGYLRADFLKMWHAYCRDDQATQANTADTATQSRNIKRLNDV
jgi:hypothetical protein